MSMYQGIDLSRFKKIASNDKVSTLRHSKGHEIKIAHSSLSPEMQGRLASMPVYMAEGGDPTAIDPESPEEVLEEPVAIEEAVPVPMPEPAAVEMPEARPPKPAAIDMAEQPTIEVMAPAPPPVYEELNQEADNDDRDMARGHIKPETIKSLYAKEDTLGKIGTLFGLLVGGAGAGLTHQPNAVLAMMQKEIDNDLEAQKASNTNSQNWLKMSRDYERQKADMAKTRADTDFQKASTSKAPYEIAESQARTGAYSADQELKILESAKTRAQLGALNSLDGTVNRMPPGPNKVNAANTLMNVVKPAIMQDIQQRNKQVSDKLNLKAAVRGDLLSQPPIDKNGIGVDFEKMNKMVQLGMVSGQMGIPTASSMSPAAFDRAADESKIVAKNRKIYQMYTDAFNRLDSQAVGGVLNKNAREAEIRALGEQIAKETTGTFSPDAYKKQSEAMFPSATDWGKAREAKFRNGVEHFKLQEQATPILDFFHLKTAFPEAVREKTKKKADSGPKEGTKGNFAGKPVVFKGGKWVRQ